jgi:hypothetical protein
MSDKQTEDICNTICWVVFVVCFVVLCIKGCHV